jgi:hypothetical protein
MTARATMTAAKMMVRVSDRQSPIVSPHTHWLPLEMSQMASVAIAASRMSASVNSYRRGDCAGWAEPLAAACCRCGTRAMRPIRNANTPMMAKTIIASTKIVDRCSKDGQTLPLNRLHSRRSNVRSA